MDQTITDVWAQHPTLEFIQQPMFESLRRWMGGQIPTQDIPLEFTMTALDDAGIDLGILSAWHGPQGVLISNDDVARCVQCYPERFRGLASVDLNKPVQAIRALRRCVQEDGFIGLRVIPWLWNLPPNDRRYYPLYAECVELDIPFCTQAGHTGPLCPSEPGRPIPYLDDVALDFPELKIVAGHIGYPWTTEMIALATKYDNVYIDTSAYVSHRFPAELVQYMQGSGRHKVLFGSNWPMIPPAKCLQNLSQLQLDDETTQLFLHGNAQKVFSL